MLTSIASRLELPQELWSMTIKELRDRKSQSELAYLWTAVRYVSHLFRAEVEKLFEEEHLIKTWLHADCGALCSTCTDGTCQRCTKRQPCSLEDPTFDFVRVGAEDRDRAIFVPSEGDIEEKGQIFHALRTNMHLDQTPRPSVFAVQVRGGLNDPGLPGLTMNEATQEISVNWKQLLTCFFVQKTAAEELERSDNMQRRMSLWPIAWHGRPVARRFCGGRSERSRVQRPLTPTAHDDYRTRWAEHYAEAQAASHALSGRMHFIELYQDLFRRKQVIQWRFACGEAIATGKNGLWLDKLRRRIAADQELYFDNDGLAGPGNQIPIESLRETEAIWWGKPK